jgi:hypothetical protein
LHCTAQSADVIAALGFPVLIACTPMPACLQTELPVGMRVLRVRGGAATVAAAGGQYTARLTLVPSPRDDVIATKYRPPGEAEEAAGKRCFVCTASLAAVCCHSVRAGSACAWQLLL